MGKNKDKLFLSFFIIVLIIGAMQIFFIEYKRENVTGTITKVKEQKLFYNTYYIYIQSHKILCSQEEFGQLKDNKEYTIYWATNLVNPFQTKRLIYFKLIE